MNPLPALASDYTRMVAEILLWIIMGGGVALLLGATMSAVLVRVYRRNWVWFLTPLFAALWFALIFGFMQLWASYQYRAAPPEAPVAPLGPAPDEG